MLCEARKRPTPKWCVCMNFDASEKHKGSLDKQRIKIETTQLNSHRFSLFRSGSFFVMQELYTRQAYARTHTGTCKALAYTIFGGENDLR